MHAVIFKTNLMRYFDFHAHIILKQLFSEQPNIDVRVNGNDVTAIPRWCTDLPNIIQTQSHQSQLASLSGEVIIGAVVAGFKTLRTEIMTDRTHAPARLIHHEAAHQTTPQKSEGCAKPTTSENSRNHSRQNESGRNPIQVRAVHPEKTPIAH